MQIRLTATIIALVTTGLQAADYPLAPHLAGPWWTIADDPDLGALKGIQITRLEWAAVR